MTAVYHKSSNDNDESNNNEDKVYLLPRRWGLVGHILDQMLDHVLDHMIIRFIPTALQLVWSLGLLYP